MLLTYTWNHIKLLASICHTIDTQTTVTDNWMRLLDLHHMSTFPFTLWPITYRNSAVFASTAFVSPRVVSISDSDVHIKFYISNDVMVICFQNSGGSDTGYGYGEENEGGEGGKKPPDQYTKRFIKSVRGKIAKEMSRPRESGDIPLKYVICVGYNTEAVLAILMSIEIVERINAESEFFGKTDEAKVKVDCVTFSVPSVMSDIWKKFSEMVDRNINIVHASDTRPKIPVNPIIVGSVHDSRPTSIMSSSIKNLLPARKSRTPSGVSIQKYIEALQKNIGVS